MEYPFKDLMPLDEVLEREGYYKDWTHLDPEVFYSLTQISNFIKTKGYGVDVRLLIAQLAEHFGLKTTQVVDLANLLSTKHDALKAQFDVVIRDATSGADWGGEIVLARGGKATLGQRLDETTAQLAKKAQQIGVNILDFGGNADGATNNVTAFNSAKVNGRIYFPQNAAKNAKYYFVTDVNFDNLEISSDKGVVISLPSSNTKNFNLTTFHNNVDFEFRDRGRIVPLLSGKSQDLLFTLLSDDKSDYHYNNVTQLGLVDVSRRLFDTLTETAGTDIAGTITFNGTFNLFKMSNTISNNLNAYYATLTSYQNGDNFNSVVRFDSEETSANLRLGVLATDASKDSYVVVTMNKNKEIYLTTKLKGQTVSEQKIADYSTLFGDAYKFKGSFIQSWRMVSKNQFEFYVNGVLVATIKTTFDIDTVGFAINGYNETSHGINITWWGRLTKTRQEVGTNGNSLKIAVFGDSLSKGESSVGWTEYIKHLTQGRAGINTVNIDNYAQYGQTVNMMIDTMNTVDLTQYDVILILIGTNNIRRAESWIFCKPFYEDAIAKCRNAKAKIVIGIPPIYTNYTETNTGINFSNAEGGGEIRNLVFEIASGDDVVVVDLLKAMGRIGLDNYMSLIQDNIHLTHYAELLIAKAFAKGIIKAVTLNAEVAGSQSSSTSTTSQVLTLQNGWLSLGATYGDPKVFKYGDVVSLSGGLKSGAITADTVIAVIPEGYRPSKNKMFPLLQSDNTTGWVEIVASTGVLRVRNLTAAAQTYSVLNTVLYNVNA